METSGGNDSRQPVLPTIGETSEGGNVDPPNFISYQQLLQAILNGTWWRVELLYSEDSSAARARITEDKDTPLMVAVKSGWSIKDLERQLSWLNKPEDLTAQNCWGNTALHEATIVGNLDAADLLFTKNPEVLQIGNIVGQLPIHTAAFYGQRKLLDFLLDRYLHRSNTDEYRWTKDNIVYLLHLTIKSKMLDVANSLVDRLQIVDRLQKEDCSFWEKDALVLIAQDPLAFPSSIKDWWQPFVYKGTPLELVAQDLIPDEKAQYPHAWQRFFYNVMPRRVQHILEMKFIHEQAIRLANKLINQLHRCPTPSSSTRDTLMRTLMLAVENGIEEIVAMILVKFPDATSWELEDWSEDWTPSSSRKSALFFAVKYRRERIFSIIIHEMQERKQLFSALLERRNSILFLVARMPNEPQLERVSGAVLQIQHELQWYKEVERLVPVPARAAKNSENMTPVMVFDEAHRDMLKSEQKWVVGMATACTVATTIIGTIAFAAAVQPPGGNNSDGHPVLSGETAFKCFAYSNAVALYAAISTFLIFLSMFTARYAAIDFLRSVPNRLIIGLLALFVSVASTIVAFGSVLYIMLPQESYKILSPVAGVLFIVPVILFAFLQLPILANMWKTTYGRSKFSSVKNELNKLKAIQNTLYFQEAEIGIFRKLFSGSRNTLVRRSAELSSGVNQKWSEPVRTRPDSCCILMP